MLTIHIKPNTNETLTEKENQSRIIAVIIIITVVFAIYIRIINNPTPEMLAKSITILDKHFQDYTNTEGKHSKKLLIRWKNDTDRDIYVVKAHIIIYKISGKIVISDYIYSSTNPVPPGSEYQDDRGIVLTLHPGDRLISIDAKISKASDRPAI